MTEEIIKTVWSFTYFRRHIPAEAKATIEYVMARPELYDSFTMMVQSSREGVCACKCISCGHNIFGDQALGGTVIMEPQSEIDGRWVKLLCPVCTKCAKGDLDIMQTRCIEYLNKCMGSENTEILP